MSRLDPSTGRQDAERGLVWYDAQALTLEGKGFADTDVYYCRLPARAATKVRQPVWNLAHQTLKSV